MVYCARLYNTSNVRKNVTREYLDKLIPDRPAWIEDETGHNAWFNTKALEAAGITKEFKDTPEEFFSRTADGDIAGVAYEGAMNPFLDVLPPFDTSVLKDGFMSLLNEGTALGITNIGDAYVFENDLQAWQELKQEGKIQQHVSLYLKGNLGTNELTPVSEWNAIWEKYDLPGIKGVKMGMGGAIESASEALVDGYADPKNSSRPIVDKEAFAAYVQALDNAGF